MMSLVFKLQKWVIWLALVGYFLMGTHAFAGVVTCIAANGHIATEWSHVGSFSTKLVPALEAHASNHGPCVDVAAELPASASQVKVEVRGDHPLLVPAEPAISAWRPAFYDSFAVGLLSPPPETGLDARSAFVETVRLLI